jgi:hypothetical protein
LVYGSSLSKSVVIDDWGGIGEKLYWCQGICERDGKIIDLSKKNDLEAGALKDRPYLNLALFWGTEWNQYVAEGKPLNQIKPEQAESTAPIGMNVSAAHGKFYPACADQPAVIWLNTIKRANDDALKLLSSFGVPVRAECR